MRARRGEAPMRTQSSIALSPDGTTWILVNASVDLPRQLAQATALWPHGLRENPFAAVLLTDANVDHTAGLGELRQNPGPLVIVSSRSTKELLASERAYERFTRAPHLWTDNPAEVGIDSLEIEMIDVPGLLPGYAGRKPAQGAVVAYIMRDPQTNVQVTIAPIFSDIDDRLYAAIAASDLAFLDGTFYSNDELRQFGAMAKDARSLGHAPIGGPDGTLARIGKLANRRVFVHVNNTNPMLDSRSAAHAAVTAAACEMAEDGWQAELSSQP
jgi:pyrroloquinoline quinone biosynthesis protein B